MPLAKDLLHPSPEEEKRKHKKKRLVQSPNSYFMDVKCPGEPPHALCSQHSYLPAQLLAAKNQLRLVEVEGREEGNQDSLPFLLALLAEEGGCHIGRALRRAQSQMVFFRLGLGRDDADIETWVPGGENGISRDGRRSPTSTFLSWTAPCCLPLSMLKLEWA
uniref:Ribosomal protein S27 n=1 Tax=Sphenodon punctatus TaxID=8508 RepID=A0A8D0GDG4_SPHPU